MPSDMKTGRINNGAVAGPADRLKSFGICRLASQLFKDFGNNPETPAVPGNLIASRVACHLSPLT